jgi:hypothetical protein
MKIVPVILGIKVDQATLGEVFPLVYLEHPQTHVSKIQAPLIQVAVMAEIPCLNIPVKTEI